MDSHNCAPRSPAGRGSNGARFPNGIEGGKRTSTVQLVLVISLHGRGYSLVWALSGSCPASSSRIRWLETHSIGLSCYRFSRLHRNADRPARDDSARCWYGHELTDLL